MSLQNQKESRRQTNRSRNTELAGEKVNDKDGAPGSEETLTAEIASMHQLLKQMDAIQTTALAETKQSTSDIEGKLSVISEHLDNADARLSLPETVAEAAKADPLVPTSQMEQMRKWVDDLEASGRRNNQRFPGFPEGCEDGSAVDFLEKILPELLGIDFPRGLIIERAHRTLAPHQDG